MKRLGNRAWRGMLGGISGRIRGVSRYWRTTELGREPPCGVKIAVWARRARALPAQCLDPAAGGDALRVRIQDDLEQQGRIVSRSPFLVVLIASGEHREIDLLIDQPINGELVPAAPLNVRCAHVSLY